MKKYLLILFFLGAVTASFAQDEAQKEGGKLEALKIAYITRKLDLSSAEAQKFWPIYNQYALEMKRIRKEQKDEKTTELDVEQKVLNIRKKYNGEFTKALSAEKINTFFRTEKEFSTYIQRELQERRMNRRLNNKPIRQ